MKHFNLLLLCTLCVGLALTSGCASIFCGASKTVSINSQPDGANFSIKGHDGTTVHSGVTPSTVSLKRGRGYFAAGDYTLTFEKQGYKTVNMPMKQGLETGWYLLGNALFGGLIGWVIVDPLTGGMWDIKDTKVDLQPEGTTMDILLNPVQTRVVNINQVPEGMRASMARIN